MIDELIDLWHDAPWYARAVFFGVVPASVLAIVAGVVLAVRA
ncbi:hypothetical protein AB0H37_24715 [Actinomadura sp. NPDC023710]